MTLSDRQNNFSTDMAIFILWCVSQGYKITRGEALRTQYQQEEYLRLGYTRVDHSKHQDKLAQDLNFWFDGVSMWDMSENMLRMSMQRVGDKWESLRQGNRWGGNFDSFFDPTHFEG